MQNMYQYISEKKKLKNKLVLYEQINSTEKW